ncbi:MAG TPA: diguanylate cyclase [Thermoanaerobaculia bacterium]|nr:diguanylate cyclase [Thermoanaerobaculia bacterium]
MLTPEDQPSRRRSDLDVEEIERKIRVLAVDDDPAYLRYVKLVLGRAGFDVEVASDGAAAIERLHQDGAFDLLLIDLAMPGIDGIETVRRIQNEFPLPGLYTILLTAHEGTETKLRALNSGLDDFLTKNSSESEIVAKIRSAARRVEMERRLHLQNEELQTLALTDELTGIANRRALFRAGDEVLTAGRRLSVALFDLDRFKQINDTYGHPTGDRILAEVATAFKANTRYGDVIARYGGDEFVLLLPDTEFDEARQISDRILAKIRQLSWTISDAVLSVNAQYGLAAATSGTSLPELLTVCDQALYRRKRRTDSEVSDRPAL